MNIIPLIVFMGVPVAVVVILVVWRIRHLRKRDENWGACPYCKEPITSTARRCPYCGEYMPIGGDA